MTIQDKTINMKLKASNARQAKIIEFLEDRPITYIFTEAMEMYMKVHEAMHSKAIGEALDLQATPVKPPESPSEDKGHGTGEAPKTASAAKTFLNR
ncbi:hypothetical protein [Bacillus toyonensis]|uniref:hypothetical protein n=1 Tax=Bacillus toyonensis TaxID=155322 RepID=UPI000BF189F9|nr:hypothetical protein [Bacillus toyonensis]PEL24284.1 hypothetical protein CN624_17965 [Bacillus toyonensis]